MNAMTDPVPSTSAARRGLASGLLPLEVHALLGWGLAIATLGLVGYWVPSAEKVLGESYLIFFFHFPSAINCLNFFFFAGVASAWHLARRTSGSDLWAASAVEVGVLACTITLVTGSIWAKAAWGMFWDMADPRLMTVAIMWLTYAGYLALRASIDEPEKRARFSAVFAVVAAVNIPLVYFSIQWFGKSHHPMQVVMDERSMVITRWFGAGAFFVLYTALWRLRRRVLACEREALALQDALSRSGA
jgi:heme exporter protein C